MKKCKIVTKYKIWVELEQYDTPKQYDYIETQCNWKALKSKHSQAFDSYEDAVKFFNSLLIGD